MRSLHINLEVSEQEQQIVFRILPSREQLRDWILHLLLIREKVVDRVTFENGKCCLTIGIKVKKRRQASNPSMMLDNERHHPMLLLTDDMLDSLIRFYLSIYCGENDNLAHIDVIVDRVDSTLPYSRYAFTFGVS